MPTALLPGPTELIINLFQNSSSSSSLLSHYLMLDVFSSIFYFISKIPDARGRFRPRQVILRARVDLGWNQPLCCPQLWPQARARAGAHMLDKQAEIFRRTGLILYMVNPESARSSKFANHLTSCYVILSLFTSGRCLMLIKASFILSMQCCCEIADLIFKIVWECLQNLHKGRICDNLIKLMGVKTAISVKDHPTLNSH